MASPLVQIKSKSVRYDPYMHKNPFREWARVVDGGDAPVTYPDNTVTLHTLEQMHTAVSGHIQNIILSVTLSGDHTTTLLPLRAVRGKMG